MTLKELKKELAKRGVTEGAPFNCAIDGEICSNHWNWSDLTYENGSWVFDGVCCVYYLYFEPNLKFATPVKKSEPFDSDLIKEKDRQIKHLNSMVEEWKGIANERLEIILGYKELLKNK